MLEGEAMSILEIRVKRSYYLRVAVITLFTFGLGALVMWFEYRRWVKIFDDVGVMRCDGKRFFWTDLKNVNYVRIHGKSGQSYFNNIELVFKRGKALVFPIVLENGPEVMSYIDGIQRKQPPALSEGQSSYF